MEKATKKVVVLVMKRDIMKDSRLLKNYFMKKLYSTILLVFITIPALAVGELGAWDKSEKDSVWSLFTPLFIFIGLIILAWFDRKNK